MSSQSGAAPARSTGVYTDRTSPREHVRGITDILHRRGRRTIDLTVERELGDRTARTWQVTSTWTCAAKNHDTLSAVKNDGCTCPDALNNRARYEKARRTGRVAPLTDVIGVRRRLQALAVMGWPSDVLAERLGLDPANLTQLRLNRSSVSGRVRAAIIALYDELADVQGPSASAAKRAKAKGWQPPIAWDDDAIDDPSSSPARSAKAPCNDVDPVVVERALTGERMTLTRPERAEAVRQLLAKGHGVGRISDVLHMSASTTRRLIERVSTTSPSVKQRETSQPVEVAS